MNAIKRVYASTLNPNALLYRRQHGLIDYDERMAILIQEVRGEPFGDYWFPTLAGVVRFDPAALTPVDVAPAIVAAIPALH